VQGAETAAAAGVASQRKVVDAFLAAVRAGDFDGLLAVLDPDLTVRVDAGAAATGRATEIHGAATWARQAISYAKGARFVQPMLVDGEVGLVLAPQGRLLRVLRFNFEQHKIAGIEIFGDRHRIREFELAVLNG
jgi:RNA polymerase sigma-70 factor (ECF subfamily)